MSITVPTAEERVDGSSGSGAGLLLVMCSVVLAVVSWPALPFAESPAPVAVPASSAAPGIQPPSTETARLWGAPVPLGSFDRVVGVDDAVLAVARSGFWPVSLLREGEWTRLLGLPAGLDVSPQVGVAVPDGFVVAGVADDRTVLFGFTTEGRFRGARTVFGIRAGAMVAVDDTVVVFDSGRPAATLVGTDLVSIDTPGVILGAAYEPGALVVLGQDGAVHVSGDDGATWRLLGSGYRAVMNTDGIHAIGESASVGINRYANGMLVRLEHAPWGPIGAWGDRLAVYDWSTESVWISSDEGWKRVPLWSSVGLEGSRVEIVDGVSTPTVIGVDTDGRPVLWQAKD